MDDNKDKIKGVLKGRLPSDKDLKNEITQAQRFVFPVSCVLLMCIIFWICFLKFSYQTFLVFLRLGEVFFLLINENTTATVFRYEAKHRHQNILHIAGLENALFDSLLSVKNMHELNHNGKQKCIYMQMSVLVNQDDLCIL